MTLNIMALNAECCLLSVIYAECHKQTHPTMLNVVMLSAVAPIIVEATGVYLNKCL